MTHSDHGAPRDGDSTRETGGAAGPAEAPGQSARDRERGGGREAPSRRDVVARASTVAMVAGVGAGYGALAAMAGRYLYPAEPRATRWLYVAPVARFALGESLSFRTPVGETVTIARQGEQGEVDDFVALSSTCPHLGCQVHWQGPQERFFCPCHNGVFAPDGSPVSGPPAEAATPLPRFPLRIESGILYIEAPVERLAQAGQRAGEGGLPPEGPGHDPCLRRRPFGPPHGGDGEIA